MLIIAFFRSCVKVMFSVVSVRQSVSHSVRAEWSTLYRAPPWKTEPPSAPPPVQGPARSAQKYSNLFIINYVRSASGWLTSYWNVLSCYRSQTKFGQVMFLHPYGSHSVQREVVYTPLGRHLPPPKVDN